MSDQALLEEIRAIRESQRRTELAISGDATLGIPGIAKRLGTVEGRMKTIQTERVRLAGMVIGASGVISVVGSVVGWLLSR